MREAAGTPRVRYSTTANAMPIRGRNRKPPKILPRGSLQLVSARRFVQDRRQATQRRGVT